MSDRGIQTPQAPTLFPDFRRKLFVRFQRMQTTRGPFYAVYLTHWFYLTNYTFRGERRYFVRVGDWRKNFGGVRG